MLSYVLLHTLGATVVSVIAYIITSIIAINTIGSDTDRAGNGLQFLAVFFNLPLFLFGSLLIVALFRKLLGDPKAVRPTYIAVVVLALLAGIFEVVV